MTTRARPSITFATATLLLLLLVSPSIVGIVPRAARAGSGPDTGAEVATAATTPAAGRATGTITCRFRAESGTTGSSSSTLTAGISAHVGRGADAQGGLADCGRRGALAAAGAGAGALGRLGCVLARCGWHC